MVVLSTSCSFKRIKMGFGYRKSFRGLSVIAVRALPRPPGSTYMKPASVHSFLLADPANIFHTCAFPVTREQHQTRCFTLLLPSTKSLSNLDLSLYPSRLTFAKIFLPSEQEDNNKIYSLGLAFPENAG